MSSWSGARSPLGKATRRRILRRDRHTCQACGGERCGNQQLEIDHVIPVAEGGTDDDDNLRVLGARPCHSDKTKAEQQRGRERRSGRRPPKPHPGLKRA